MKRLFVLFVLLTGCTSVPKQIINSVVSVEDSSGVIIHSDKEATLILTAYHVVEDKYEKHSNCSGCAWSTVISVVETEKRVKPSINYIDYGVRNIEVDTVNDLAIIELSTEQRFVHSTLSNSEPEIGDDVWIGANPNFNYRSLKKGILSSDERIKGNHWFYEVSGGVIFGTSGGGVFNSSGSLVAIVNSVDYWTSRFCKGNKLLGEVCVEEQLTDIGYAVPLPIIKGFLASTSYARYFK